MSKRTIYFSPHQMGFLYGLKTAINRPLDLSYIPSPVNVDAIVYGTMIQCGVEKFETQEYIESLVESKFLRARFSYFPENKYVKSRQIVSDIFSRFPPHRPQSETDIAKLTNVEILKEFIIDLITSIEYQSSCITLLPIPEIKELEGQLPPELFYPIKTLINSFEPLAPSLPCPRLSVRSMDVNRFQQLISSDLFSNYSSQHGILEKSSISKDYALTNVVESGSNIVKKNIDFLQLRELIISILPVTSSLIDTVFGKLPGALADHFANLLTSFIKNEKRIIVYQLDSIMSDLLSYRSQKNHAD